MELAYIEDVPLDDNVPWKASSTDQNPIKFNGGITKIV